MPAWLEGRGPLGQRGRGRRLTRKSSPRFAGKGVFARLKFESGVHRVQRVPATEASGRIHTSAATVAVLPEAEEVDIDIKPKISASTRCAPRVPVASTSTPPIPRFASPICRPASRVVGHRKNRSTRTVRAPCRCLRARLYDLERQKADSERSASRRRAGRLRRSLGAHPDL